MITHIVLFTFQNRSHDEAVKVKELLEGLPSQIPYIRDLSVGTNVVPSDRAFDLGLIVKFDSLDDLNRYATDPAHLKVIEYINRVKERTVAVDFES